MNRVGRPPLVLQNALLVTQDGTRRVLRGDLRVEGGRFSHVGPSAPTEGAEVVDASRFAAVPGFINAHTHVAMAPLRGVADDVDLSGFLEALFRVDARRTEEDIEAGAALGIAEMLLGGTTSFVDLYYGEDAVARAVARLGARGFLGWAVLDAQFTTQKGVPVDNAKEFIGRWKGHSNIVPLPAPQGVYVCGEETWLRSKELAAANGVFVHCHLSETRREVHDHESKTGLRPPLWLEKIGALTAGMVAAHGVWLTRREIEVLAARGVGVAHCPSSNMKLGTGGVAPVVELRNSGATVGLGTDSSASNNTLSMLAEIRTAGLLQKHHRWEPGALPAQQLLDLATIEGAKLIGRAKDLGSLETGKLADFSLMDLGNPSLQPARPEWIISHLAYSARDDAVDSVFVGGEPVVRGRELQREEWANIRTAGEMAAEKLRTGAG